MVNDLPCALSCGPMYVVPKVDLIYATWGLSHCVHLHVCLQQCIVATLELETEDDTRTTSFLTPASISHEFAMMLHVGLVCC